MFATVLTAVRPAFRAIATAVTRAEVLRIAQDRSLTVRVHEAKVGQKGVPSE